MVAQNNRAKHTRRTKEEKRENSRNTDLSTLQNMNICYAPKWTTTH